MAIDQDKLGEFIGKFAGDMASAFHAATVVLGDKLGLYKALVATGPATPVEIATEAGCDPIYVEEWLKAQFVSGYCGYDAETGRFHLSEEQAACLADEDSPAFLAGAMALAATLFKDEERLSRDAFRTGRGVGWHEHHADLFYGTERLFRPGYVANLTTSWIPALDGVEARLQAGARIADVGCGHGASSIVLALNYPNSTVVGFDVHGPSIDVARKRAAEAGVADRVTFEVASAKDFPGQNYDLVCIFDALHDMGDPIGSAAHIGQSLAPEGTWLLVEPMAGDKLEDNVNPVGRIFYSAGVFICVPHARSEGDTLHLGNQVSDARWQSVIADAGLSHFRRATETPFNRVFEIRR